MITYFRQRVIIVFFFNSLLNAGSILSTHNETNKSYFPLCIGDQMLEPEEYEEFMKMYKTRFRVDGINEESDSILEPNMQYPKKKNSCAEALDHLKKLGKYPIACSNDEAMLITVKVKKEAQQITHFYEITSSDLLKVAYTFYLKDPKLTKNFGLKYVAISNDGQNLFGCNDKSDEIIWIQFAEKPEKKIKNLKYLEYPWHRKDENIKKAIYALGYLDEQQKLCIITEHDEIEEFHFIDLKNT